MYLIQVEFYGVEIGIISPPLNILSTVALE